MLGKKQIDILIWAMLAALLVIIALMAAVPPVSRDALTHHLAVPKLYLQSGGIYEIPEIEFSYYPMNLDLLYMIPLYFGNDIVPKYIHFAFGLMTALLIYRFLRERTEHRFWAVLGALLFLSLPVVVKLSVTVYVDLGLVFFSTAALIFIMKWALGGRQLRLLVYAAVFCGLSLGTKYNGLISFFLLTCSIPILYIRWHFSKEAVSRASEPGPQAGGTHGLAVTCRALGAAVLFVSISLAAFSPWMVRNYRWTGNPVFPLYQSMFGLGESGAGELQSSMPAADDSALIEAEPLSHFVIRKRVFNETLLEALTTPVRIFFQGRDDNPKYFDGRLNPYLIIFPLLIFVGFGRLPRQRQIESLTLFGFAVLFLLYTFFKVDMRIRYVAPIIPPLVILAVTGFENVYLRLGDGLKGTGLAISRGSLIALMIFLIGFNVHYLVSQFAYIAPMDYLSGKIARDDYIKKYRSEYESILFINRNLPADAKLLSVYLGNRIYYSDRAMVCNDRFMRAAIGSVDTAEQLLSILRAGHYTHLFIRSAFFHQFIVEQLSLDKRLLVSQFFREKTIGLFSRKGYSVFELKRT